jgi:L-ribulose-5-phosphate 3-epimerase UlaE
MSPKPLKLPRRNFLKASAQTLALIPGIAGTAPLFAAGIPGADRDPMSRIGCTTVSFRSRFPATRRDKAVLADDLTLLDVPLLFAEKLGIHNVELWSQHFTDTSPEYCRSIRKAAADVGSRIVNIQLDDPGYHLSHPDAARRGESVKFVKSWMDRAAACGAPSIRVNTGGSKQPFNLQNTGNGYRQLAAYGQQIDVKVLIENHGGYSLDANNVVALAQYVDSPFCRILPDFGNMPTDFSWDQRSTFLKQLLPFAELVSAKGMVFDKHYNHLSYDVGACVQLAEAKGFRGIYSIELWDRSYQVPDPILAIKQMTAIITGQLA